MVNIIGYLVHRISIRDVLGSCQKGEETKKIGDITCTSS